MTDCEDTDSWQSDLFRAMNTEISVKLSPPFKHSQSDLSVKTKELAVFIHNWFRATELRFSRFRGDSELALVNRSIGNTILISAAMMEVLQLVEEYRIKTNDLFTPFILRAIEAAGYDRSFEQLTDSLYLSKSSDTATSDLPLHLITVEPALELNSGIRSVRVVGQQPIDLGGIVKGWAIDKLSIWLKKHWGITRGLVNAGGDLSVWGGSSLTEPWVIAVLSPWDHNVIATEVKLKSGAVATSSVLGRRWKTANGEAHHLIDPRTMQPSESDVVQCTVIGTTVSECEVASKVICLLGRQEGIHWLNRTFPQCSAMLFINDGTLLKHGYTVEGVQW